MSYEQDGISLLQGDVLATLAAMEPDSVDCVVTSPPYWSLRKYSGEGSVWGGDEHEHDFTRETVAGQSGGHSEKQNTNPGSFTAEAYAGTKRWQHSVNGRGEDAEARLRRDNPDDWTKITIEHGSCACGAWRGQYGLEPTPELYVEHTITVLRALRRVLKPTGVVFWNIGDGYFASGQGFGDTKTTNKNHPGSRSREKPRWPDCGLKPKDMIAMPWRVGLAAQADGWWLRADIIWAKPNPMPESVTDRPTKSHEYVLLLTKSERYFWDQDAVREQAIHEGRIVYATGAGARNGNVGDEANDRRTAAGFTDHDTLVSGRNIRSVWNIPTQPSPLPHFASFPEELASRCIKVVPALCSACGRPAYERKRLQERFLRRWGRPLHQGTWDAPTILDPFAGTGTTLKVARDLGKKAVGIEISAEYCELARKRLEYGIRGVMAIQDGQLTL